MIDFSHCQGLFRHSVFHALKRETVLPPESEKILSTLQFPEKINTFHPARTQEFQLGRLCAYEAYYKLTGKELYSLPSGDNREPLWPADVVGSISHTHEWIAAAVARSNVVLGLGIDLEGMGRAKSDLSRYITNEYDLSTHPDFSSEELLTIIFSAKESLYKALFPSVNKFFGFEAAAVTDIDSQNKSFTIRLLMPLTSVFTPGQRSLFTGRYERDHQTCLTAIEILHS